MLVVEPGGQHVEGVDDNSNDKSLQKNIVKFGALCGKAEMRKILEMAGRSPAALAVFRFFKFSMKKHLFNVINVLVFPVASGEHPT